MVSDIIFNRIIEKRYKQLNKGKDPSKYISKLNELDYCSICFILEKYVASIISKLSRKSVAYNKSVFQEYNFSTKSGKYIRIKFAEKRNAKKTYKFENIEPDFKCDYSIFFGVFENKIRYRIFFKEDIYFDQNKGKWYIKKKEFKRQLDFIDPDIFTFFNLSLKENNLYEISEFKNEIKQLDF